MSDVEFDLAQAMPFGAVIGFELVSAAPEEVVATLAWTSERTTAGGAMHGGALMSLADGAGGICAFLNLPEGATGTATVESKTNFFRAVRSGSARATARPLHVGRTFIVVQTDVADDDGRAVTMTVQTQAVLTA